jgi:hypothetical protein
MDLSKSMNQMLKDHDQAVQGAVLATLLAKWVAGHSEKARIGLIEMHIDSVRNMVAILLEEMKNAHERQAGGSPN